MDDTPTLEQPAPISDIYDGWTWAIVEIFGHRRHVGRSREEEKFGSKLCRIDVPKLDAAGAVTWSSHFYGGASIFSFTPTDEQTVMKYAERPCVPAIPYHEADDEKRRRGLQRMIDCAEVIQRADALRLTRKELAERAGLSGATMFQVGRGAGVHSTTLAKLEVALVVEETRLLNHLLRLHPPEGNGQ